MNLGGHKLSEYGQKLGKELSNIYSKSWKLTKLGS